MGWKSTGEVRPETHTPTNMETEFAERLSRLSDDQFVTFLEGVLAMGTSRAEDVTRILNTSHSHQGGRA